jgi:hypothetical protein
VDGEPPDDRLRLEWESAAGRPAIVIAIGKAGVPKQLSELPVLQLKAGETISERTFERLRATLWQTEEEEIPAELPTDEQIDAAVKALQAHVAAERERDAPRAAEHLRDERKRLTQELALTQDDATRASLEYALGICERQLDQPVAAREHLVVATGLLEQVFGASDTKLAEATFNLGMVCAELGAGFDAERWLLRAVEIGERAFEQNDVRIRLFKTRLAEVRSAQEVS